MSATCLAVSDAKTAFLRKVYLTLLAGVMTAMGIGWFLVNQVVQSGALKIVAEAKESTTALVARTIASGPHDSILASLWSHPVLMIIAYFAIFFVCLFTRKVRGVNIASFIAFAVMVGTILAPTLLVEYVASKNSYTTILSAFWLTAAVFGGLTGYVFWSGRDFTFMGGFLFTGLIALLGFMILAIFIPVISAGVSAAAILIFSAYILYDTSDILRNYDYDEWVGGALALFLDVINLFIHILRIISENRD